MGSTQSEEITTLSGLRGHIEDDTIYFQSVLPASDSPTFTPCHSSLPHLANCPSFMIQGSREDLAIPRQEPSASRPNISTNSTTSRLASLFAGTGRERSPSVASTNEIDLPLPLATIPNLTCTVYFTDRAIRYAEVTHVIGKANESTLRLRLRPLLMDIKGEDEVFEKCLSLLARFQPEKKRSRRSSSTTTNPGTRIALF